MLLCVVTSNLLMFTALLSQNLRGPIAVDLHVNKQIHSNYHRQMPPATLSPQGLHETLAASRVLYLAPLHW
jgi:hypothetical protein